MKPYCTQNDGNCSTCSLVSYGHDCQNNPLPKGQQSQVIFRVPAEIKKAFKLKAMQNNTSAQELLENFVNDYLKGDE